MIRINNELIDKIILITDFDKTLTTNSSNSTIGVFSNFLCREYVDKKKN